MNTDIIDVSPSIASDLLKLNTKNRRLSPSRVEFLSAQMKSGQFIFNGDSIRISESGVLLDGQHRLAAIVKSGTTQKMMIINGLADESFTTIDVGAARTSSDFLMLSGVKNSMALAAAGRLALSFEVTGSPDISTKWKQLSKKEIHDYSVKNTNLQKAVNFVEARKDLKRVAPPSITAFCLYHFMLKDERKALEFASEFESGEVSYKNSPVTAVRNAIIFGGARKESRKYICGILFKSFKSFCEGVELKIIRLPQNKDEWFIL